MKLSTESLSELADVAEQAARDAGALIASYREREVKVLHKETGDTLASQVVTEVDELAQTLILKHLQLSIQSYDLALLTEELEDNGSRHAKEAFWCIDPMDGTLPFTQGIPGYSVSIALVARDGTPLIGVVYDPVKEKLYRAVAGQGIEIDGQVWTSKLEYSSELSFYCDCTFDAHPERDAIVADMEAFAQEQGYSGLAIKVGGGGVLNACWVLERPPAIYFKRPKIQVGGGSIWDFAATACLFHEAGLAATDFNGAPLDLNRAESTFMNHRGVCYATDVMLAEALRNWSA